MESFMKEHTFVSHLPHSFKADFFSLTWQSSIKLLRSWPHKQFYAFLFTDNSMESNENAPLWTSTLGNKPVKKESQKFKVYYCRVMLTQCLHQILMAVVRNFEVIERERGPCD